MHSIAYRAYKKITKNTIGLLLRVKKERLTFAFSNELR